MFDLTNVPNWSGLAEHTLLNGPGLTFWVCSNGTFAFVSPQMLNALGYTWGEMAELKVTDILLGFEEDDRDKLRNRIDNAGIHIRRATLRKKDRSTMSVDAQNHGIQVGDDKFNVSFCKEIFESEDTSSSTSLTKEFVENYERKGPSLYDICDELGIVGSSRTLIDTLTLADSYAKNSRPLLIRGETGVGKESLAHLVHRLSRLREAPFERVNCGTITDELALSGLFGHVKGAFTGAVSDYDGIFARAEGGTVFLDEVGELPIRVQAMLLRVLQDGEYMKLGGSKLLKSNVRIIAATNRDLKSMVADGTFREDLFHRLDFLRLSLPSLRDRTGDVTILVKHRLSYLNKTEFLEREMPTDEGMRMLESYHFPGNIRELFGLLERAYFDGSVGPVQVTQELLSISDGKGPQEIKLLSFAENERRHLLRVLTHCKWKIGGKGGAAEILGLPRTTLISKMERLGLEKQEAVMRKIGA